MIQEQLSGKIIAALESRAIASHPLRPSYAGFATAR
jgi:hypothetical protein